MKLSILVPHYKETAEVIRPLLDSIAIQQNVNFKDIEVVIAHDGEEAKNFLLTDNVNLLEDDGMGLLDNYPFEIKQVRQEHKGVSAARNTAFDNSEGDYVMFCDADDMFLNACGLWMVFREMEVGFDSLVSCFVEESRLPDTKEVAYINHDVDSTFVHGKVHRKQYLIDQKIQWNENLTIHEDSFFNILCQNLSQDVKYCPTPFYLWKWRDDSVCRHDPKYILRTYRNLVDSNDALIGEFIKRGVQDKALFFTAFMIWDAYYTMNKPEWINQENKEYRDGTEARFARYYKKYRDLWESVPLQDKMVISNQVRGRVVMEGMQIEAVTITQWLKHIEQLKEKDYDSE